MGKKIDVEKSLNAIYEKIFDSFHARIDTLENEIEILKSNQTALIKATLFNGHDKSGGLGYRVCVGNLNEYRYKDFSEVEYAEAAVEMARFLGETASIVTISA